MDLKEHIRSIPDYPKKGILFRDITTLIKNENAFAESINQIVERVKEIKFEKIAAIESRGFVFASAVSYILKKPFIMLRKKNKLPSDVYSVDFDLEYGSATIEMHKDSVNEKDKVLIIDDLIATGGTAEAAAKLIEISKFFSRYICSFWQCFRINFHFFILNPLRPAFWTFSKLHPLQTRLIF